jgi:hypothetical protein
LFDRIQGLGDDAEAGDQFRARQCAITHYLFDILAQTARVELGLQDRNAPGTAFERRRRKPEIKLLHLRRAIAERQRAGNDGSGRSAADEIEVIAETDVAPVMLAEQRFHALEKGNGERAAYAAAVQREKTLWSGAEQMAVAGRFELLGDFILHCGCCLLAGG